MAGIAVLIAFWRAVPDGVCVAVMVQAKSRRPQLQTRAPAPHGGRNHVGVTEAPEDDWPRQRRAACAMLACAPGVPATAVHVLSGPASRGETPLFAGDPALRLERLVGL